METQNFRPPDERELIFSAYSIAGDKCDVCGVDLATKKVIKVHRLARGVRRAGGHFSGRPSRRSSNATARIARARATSTFGSSRSIEQRRGKYERLTFFSDYPGYKASNPVVSDDGRLIAFQMGQSVDAAGVGHGLFIYDVAKAERRRTLRHSARQPTTSAPLHPVPERR